MTVYGGVRILYCDNHVLIAVKPPNMLSQADETGDADMLTLMRAYIKESRNKPGEAYLGLLHRLDRPVGGVMAFARTSKAAARVSAQFRDRSVRRTYLAVVWGTPSDNGELTGRIACREAVLSYQCAGRRPPLSLLLVTLGTGRKHQIRIQLSEAGLPVFGDARYGRGKPGQQIALWAFGITFTHPKTREPMTFHAPPPQTYPWTIWRNQP